MKRNEEIWYCENSKGHKIPPYQSNYTVPKSKAKWSIYGYAVIVGLITVAIFLMSCSVPTKCGDPLTTHNGVYVYYNKISIESCDGTRNLSPNGYSYGLKWQCVEFIRRYYYEYLDHEMPSRYGHASDYFRQSVPDGTINVERNLLQYQNGVTKPQVDDILVWAGGYGHVAIVTEVTDSTVSIIAQNVGENCTETLPLTENRIGYGVTGLLRLNK